MSDYITKSTLKSDYNLTEALIKKLGEPDKTAPNPHYRSVGAPMQLYLRERVEEWVEDNADLIAKSLARRQKIAAKKPRTPPKPEPPMPPRIPSRPAQIWRTSVRKSGIMWSWTVYHSPSGCLIKAGWSLTKYDAHEAAQQAIRDYREAQWDT